MLEVRADLVHDGFVLKVEPSRLVELPHSLNFLSRNEQNLVLVSASASPKRATCYRVWYYSNIPHLLLSIIYGHPTGAAGSGTNPLQTRPKFGCHTHPLPSTL